MSGDCQLCTTVAQGGPAGGWVAATDQWAVMGHPLQVPGWLSMLTLRHCESMAEMTGAEAAELGGLSQQVARALMATSGATRVYSYSLGHAVRHLHLLIGVPGLTADTEGPRLLTRIVQRDPSIVDAQSSADRLAAVGAWLEAHPIDV